MSKIIPIKPIPAQAAAIASDGVEEHLYEVRQKIYARSVTGIFANWRWAMVWFTQLLFYGLCWLPWGERQAVLFHLVERKFYIFGLVFWPQDVFYLAVLLIISAFSLFLFTAVAGRLWCGYTCPQTVYTEIFMWIEMKFEGERSARMKLAAAPMSLEKFARKGGKYLAYTAVALWTGFTFVGYFTPIRELRLEVFAFTLGPWETFWIFFYGGMTYLFAGVMREQVCKYMCPYARFQGVMFDPDTLVITYDSERGDPRGARKKGSDYKAQGKGDCVDCGICVQVCPTGIDIRKGLQYECIGCAACIDACDQVMDKVGYPKGLIRYSTERALKAHWGWRDIAAHIVRPRVLIYSAILWGVIIAFIWGLATKPALRVDVIRDRATLSREVPGGYIENVYNLHVMNVTERSAQFYITVSGQSGIRLAHDTSVALDPGSARTVTVQVQVPADTVKAGASDIFFDVSSQGENPITVSEKATFLHME
jgi:cytochrome c oxidase accessory protein FixG